MNGRLRLGAGACLLALLTTLPACARESHESKEDAPTPAPAPAPAVLSTPWCAEGWCALDDATCVALPDRFATPASLVVYAHGMIAPDALPSEEQATLLAAAREHGFAVLFARGRPGLCAWEPKVA